MDDKYLHNANPSISNIISKHRQRSFLYKLREFALITVMMSFLNRQSTIHALIHHPITTISRCHVSAKSNIKSSIVIVSKTTPTTAKRNYHYHLPTQTHHRCFASSTNNIADSDNNNNVAKSPSSSTETPPKPPSQRRRPYGNRDYGKDDNFMITRWYEIPSDGFASLQKTSDNDEEHGTMPAPSPVDSRMATLGLTSENVTLPVALTMVDNETYPTLSRARKACRQGKIMIHRGPLSMDQETGEAVFDEEKCLRGRAADRIYPSDVIAERVRTGGAFYPGLTGNKPNINVTVVYEDDHFAIVNKPAGTVTYAHRNHNHGTNTIRSIAPFILRPPSPGTLAILRRPQPIHRLDKPTSGLLLLAKTKPSMAHITHQFVNRQVKKTYHAILNGIPPEMTTTTSATGGDEQHQRAMTGRDAREIWGADLAETEDDEIWQMIDFPLDEKSCLTMWKAKRYANSIKADQEMLTLVEVKPLTGRYHQIRRHMAYVCERPLVGDSTYDGGGESAMSFRSSGLFLCSNRVILEHPYYNTEEGQKEWNDLSDEMKQSFCLGKNVRFIEVSVEAEVEDEKQHGKRKILVQAEIDLPDKFDKMMRKEDDRWKKFNEREN